MQYTKFSDVIKKMGGVKGLLDGKADTSRMNPQKMNQINASMAKMMDPRVLQQMGRLRLSWLLFTTAAADPSWRRWHGWVAKHDEANDGGSWRAWRLGRLG